MDNIQEIEDLDGLYRIEKIKLFKEIIPLESSFIVKDNTTIKIERKKDGRTKRRV